MKTFAATTAAIALAITLAGCHKKEPTPTKTTPAVVKPTPTKTAPGVKQPMTTAQVQAFHANFEEAMNKIPPQLRDPFQKLFQCEVTKNNKLPPAQQVTIDGDWVIKKTAELQANPALANCQPGA